MNKNYLIQTGITSDNQIVICNFYKMYETYGIPLDVMFELCIEKKWIPDWNFLYLECLNAGIGHQQILSRLEESISDSFGKNFSDVVISRLENKFSTNERKK